VEQALRGLHRPSHDTARSEAPLKVPYLGTKQAHLLTILENILLQFTERKNEKDKQAHSLSSNT